LVTIATPATSADLAALPDLEAIRAAHVRIAALVHRTPVLTCAALDAETGARLYFKCENLQKVGAFKARGAANAVFSMDDGESGNGVVTHSSGNHGAALAYAAQRRGTLGQAGERAPLRRYDSPVCRECRRPRERMRGGSA
jgi:threonine dehydratase